MRSIKKTPQLRGAISILHNTLGLQQSNYTTKARGVNSLQGQPYSRYSVLVAQDRATGFERPIQRADINRYHVRFFCVRYLRCALIMVGRSGGAFALADFSLVGRSTLLRLATLFERGERGSIELQREAAAMVATTQTHPKFIDIYWIIPLYSAKPYGKVSFTHQDRRTFHALFNDSRFIWAGRKPVQGVTHG